MRIRTVRRPRRYVARRWLTVFGFVLRYSSTRDAYVLRGIGARSGPVLRADRRTTAPRRQRPHGVERRRARAA
jgi:hypothetical protein